MPTVIPSFLDAAYRIRCSCLENRLSRAPFSIDLNVHKWKWPYND